MMASRTMIILSMVFLTSCDVVDDSYLDYDSAEQDRALVRGWLPSWTPQYATNLVSRQDLDTNAYSFAFMMPLRESLDLPKNCVAVANPPPPILFPPNFPKNVESFEHILQCPEINQNGPRYVVRKGASVFGWSIG
jgi:hypothetical protein